MFSPDSFGAVAPSSLVPMLPNLSKKGGGGEAEIQSHMINVGITSWQRGSQQLLVSNRYTNLSLSTQPFEAFSDPTTLTWRLWYHVFHSRWTGVHKNIAFPFPITMTHHLPAFVCGVTLFTWDWIQTPPPPSRICWKHLGALVQN